MYSNCGEKERSASRMIGVRGSASEGDVAAGFQPDGHGPAAFFDGNKSSWLGEIGHVFDDPAAAAAEDAGFAPPPASTAAEAEDAPRWYRTLSESPYRMAAHPVKQEEVVSTGTLARWRGKPSPERRRRAKDRARGEASPTPQYTPSSTQEDMLQRAREHVAEIDSLRDAMVPPMQTTLQRKPWRNGMSVQHSASAVAHGRRSGEATTAAAAAAIPWQLSAADQSGPSPSAHMPSVRRAKAAAERAQAKAGSPTKLKPLGPGPKAAAKPTARPTRSSNVMVTNMLSGASKKFLKNGEPNPMTFRITCLNNLASLMGGKGFVLEDPRRPRDAAKAAQMTFSSHATQPHVVEGALLELMTDDEEKPIRDAARTAYIKFHEVWAQQEDAIIKRGEELKELKEKLHAQKANADGAQMKSLSWVTNWSK